MSCIILAEHAARLRRQRIITAAEDKRVLDVGVCRMIMCPFGTSLLVGMASGGIRRLQIGRENVQSQKPKLVEVSGRRNSMLVGRQGPSHDKSATVGAAHGQCAAAAYC